MIWQADQDDLAFCAAREGCALRAYPDGRKPPTVAWGFGVNKDGLKVGDLTTYPQAIIDFIAAAPQYEADVDKVFGAMNLQPQHRGALFSLTYNVGGTTLRGSTLLIEAVHEFSDAKVDDPLDADAIAKKRKLRDLAGAQFMEVRHDAVEATYHNLSRRCQEAALFLSGNYGDLRFHPFWTETADVRAVPAPPMYLVKMPTFRGSP